MKTVHLIDFGIGNIYNVERALRHIGAKVVLCSDSAHLMDVEAMVLPGVGAFRDCLEALRARGFEKPILQHLQANKPFLGICVGMQLLADASEEFGHTEGFGVIPGIIKQIPAQTMDGARLKVPHIGWKGLQVSNQDSWDHSSLSATNPGQRVYFVHSYSYVVTEKENEMAHIDYGGNRLCAAVKKGNIMGTQFHPEKSGEVGLNILRQFLKHE